jgi:hypothetical protein
MLKGLYFPWLVVFSVEWKRVCLLLFCNNPQDVNREGEKPTSIPPATDFDWPTSVERHLRLCDGRYDRATLMLIRD